MTRRLRICVVVVLAVLSTATFVQAKNVRTATLPAGTPTITTISLPTAYVNSASFTLTVVGTNFASGAVVYMGYSGSPLTTTFVSSTKLTVEVPASYLTSSYTYGVYVTNPGNLTSNTVSFYVVTLDPTLSSVSPLDVIAGSTPGVVTVSANNFASGATILWNGLPVSTTFVNTNQLTFTPTKSQLGFPGSFSSRSRTRLPAESLPRSISILPIRRRRPFLIFPRMILCGIPTRSASTLLFPAATAAMAIPSP